jgi:endoglucanase Acf2
MVECLLNRAFIFKEKLNVVLVEIAENVGKLGAKEKNFPVVFDFKFEGLVDSVDYRFFFGFTQFNNNVASYGWHSLTPKT